MKIIDFKQAFIGKKRADLCHKRMLASKYRKEYEDQLKALKKFHFGRLSRLLCEIELLENLDGKNTDLR